MLVHSQAKLRDGRKTKFIVVNSKYCNVLFIFQSRQRAQNVIPCTVSQILKAEQGDDAFVIDNITLHQVSDSFIVSGLCF